MELLILLAFIFACYGFSNIIVYSDGPFGIFTWWRATSSKIHPKFGELFGCMMCLPMWVGGLLSGINLFFIHGFTFTPMNVIFNGSISDYSGYKLWIILMVILLIDGAIASGTSWVIHNIEEHFER